MSQTADPIECFRQISKEGTVAGTLLLESADIVTRRSERSIIISKSALKAVCRGAEVVVTALSALGKEKLKNVADQLRDHVRQQSDTSLRLEFVKSDTNSNLNERLLALSPLDVIRTMTPSGSLSAGIFSYDMIDWVEELPAARKDELNFPDYIFWLAEEAIVADYKEKYIQVKNAHAPLTFSAGDLSDTSDEEFSQIVVQLKRRIVAGDVFQIVPSRSFQMPCAKPFAAYEKLRAFNPSPYMYYIVDDDFTLFGASPETYVKVDGKSRRVEIRPIAGTRRRGVTPEGEIDHELDMRREAELRLDEKELAEHMMLVDLARNDVARVSEPKTRSVEQLLSVDRYSHVMHLVSCVKGKLRKDLDALHAYQASMNMGTLVGAPKVKAAEILRQTEKTKRGFYGGAVGYFEGDGNMNTAIVIRSAWVRDGVAHVRAGAGVVYDSVPEEETQETKNKAEAVLRAIAMVS